MPDPTGEDVASFDDYEILRRKLKDYFMPRRNKHHARYTFFKSKPVPGEKTVTYATRLREKAQDCEFGTAAQSDERILEHLIH